MVRNEGEKLRKVVVSSPLKEYYKVDNPKKHNIKEIANRKTAIKQHERLKGAMREFGAEVIDIEELEGHPNSIFTRDTSVVTPQGYIKLRMGLQTRRGEDEWMAGILNRLGIPEAGEIKSPGTAEGGDIIIAGRVAFISVSSRTNEEGASQLKSILEKMGFEVRITQLPSPHLHIGGAMSMVSPETALVCKGVFPGGFFSGLYTIEIDCGGFIDGNVLCLGEKVIIAEKMNTRTVELLGKKGYRVSALDLSEFVKGSGGPTCLTLPVERG